MNVFPTKLELAENDRLIIQWSDGQIRQYGFRELRDGCTCTTCCDKLAQQDSQSPPLLPVLTEAEMQPLKVVGMKPVGRYAYSIDFTDGHSTGVYTYARLRELGQIVA